MNKFKTLYLHDDKVDNIITDTMLSLRNDEDSVAQIRGHSIGRVINKSNNWVEPEVQDAIIAASASFTNFVRDLFLAIHAWEPWRKHPELVKIRLATECFYLVFDRHPEGPRLNFAASEVSEAWPQIINRSQSQFMITSAHVTSGSPDGGCMQFVYKLK